MNLIKTSSPTISLVLLPLLLSSCASSIAAETQPIPGESATATLAIAQSPLPAATPSLTPIATGPSVAPKLVASLGDGRASDVYWTEDGGRLAVLGSAHVTWYDTADLVEVAASSFSEQYEPLRFVHTHNAFTYFNASASEASSNLITVGVYDLDQGTVSHSLTLHPELSVPMPAPDGLTLAVLGEFDDFGQAHTLQLWDFDTGEKGEELLNRSDDANISLVGFDDNSSFITAVASDGRLWLWDIASGTLIAQARSRALDIHAATVMPGGEVVALASWDGDLWFWRATEGREPIGPFHLPVESPHLAVSSDGKLMAVTGREGPLLLLEVSPSLTITRRTILREDYNGAALRFTADSARLASIDENSAIDIWNTPDGKSIGQIASYVDYFRGIAWSPDGLTIAGGGGSNGDPGFVTMWDVETESLLWRASPVDGALGLIAYIPRNAELLVAPLPAHIYSGSRVAVLDQSLGSIRHEIIMASNQPGGIALAPSGELLAIASGSKISMFETATWGIVATFDAGSLSPALGFSSDGRVLRAFAGESESPSIKSWEVDSGHLLATRPLRQLGWSPVFSSDSALVAAQSSAIDADFAFVADTTTGQEVFAVRETHQWESFDASAFSPDSQLLALSDYHGFLIIDAVTGRTLATASRSGHAGNIAFSPDGRLLAIATDQIEVWDLSSVLENVRPATLASSTPDALLTQSAATIAAYTPTSDLRAYVDIWLPFADQALGIRFEYPAIYDQLWSGSCSPRSYLREDGERYATLGERIYLSIESTNGRSLADYANEQAQAIKDDQYSLFLSLTEEPLGKAGSLSGYELQYRFGSSGRLGLAYFLRHKDTFLVIDFTAGVTCDAREIDLYELDALQRLIDTLEFTN